MQKVRLQEIKQMGNTMPYNLEAEQSILGCVMIDNEITAEVLSALKKLMIKILKI